MYTYNVYLTSSGTCTIRFEVSMKSARLVPFARLHTPDLTYQSKEQQDRCIKLAGVQRAV